MRKSDRDKGQEETGKDRENEKREEERMYVAYASMYRECVIVRVCMCWR